MIIESLFKPAWWLTNAHAQTIYSSMRHPLSAPVDKAERMDLPDGDFLDLVWSSAGLPDDAPLISYFAWIRRLGKFQLCSTVYACI